MKHLPKVTRVEVIDGTGRAYQCHDAFTVQLSEQDDGRTLKIFIDWDLQPKPKLKERAHAKR